LKQGEMRVIEYAAIFNELSRFASNQVATEEMRMDYFEQGLKGEVKQTIAGHAYANFQEMYSLIMNETEIENKEKGQVKRKFGPRGSSSQENRNFKKFKLGTGKNKRKHPA